MTPWIKRYSGTFTFSSIEQDLPLQCKYHWSPDFLIALFLLSQIPKACVSVKFFFSIESKAYLKIVNNFNLISTFNPCLILSWIIHFYVRQSLCQQYILGIGITILWPRYSSCWRFPIIFHIKCPFPDSNNVAIINNSILLLLPHFLWCSFARSMYVHSLFIVPFSIIISDTASVDISDTLNVLSFSVSFPL